MIFYKKLSSFCIILLIQLQIVCSQWYRSCSSSAPIYYVPPSAPPEYTRAVQGYPIESSGQCQSILPPTFKYKSAVQGCSIENSGQCQPIGVASSFGYPPLSGVPTPLGFPLGGPELYEGQYQAAAAAAAHPNQPVIIINNGDYGTRKDDGGLFGGDGGDLLALLFATHAHHGHHAESGPPEPLPPPPSYDNGDRSGSGPININITIIMPKSEPESKNKTEDD